MLEASRYYFESLTNITKSKFRFLHISTDEVYGSTLNNSFDEMSKYDPSSPYSASKAASDHFVKAFYKTYNTPIILSNCSNNYGPWQYKEKLIPVVINSIFKIYFCYYEIKLKID